MSLLQNMEDHPLYVIYQRREVLRWLMFDNERSNPRIVQVIKECLEVADWELQLTAMIASAHFDAHDLLSMIRKVSFRISAEDNRVRPFYDYAHLIKKVVIKYLEKRIPLKEGDVGSLKDIDTYVLHCILFKKINKASNLSLFINSLRVPNGVKPINNLLPSGVVLKNGKYYLRDTGVELSYVPPYNHWTGEEDHVSNPIKFAKISRGFYISRYPLSENGDLSSKSAFLSVSYSEAQDLLKYLKDKVTSSLVMPSIMACEMASRGQTGRVFPWGNKLSESSFQFSPSGLVFPFGDLEYWTSSSFDNDSQFTYGSWNQKTCSGRISANKADKKFMRVALLG